LGVPEGPYLQKANAEGLNHFRAAQEKLVRAGFEICPVEAMADFDEVFDRHRTLVAAEAALVHRDWFKSFAGLYRPQTVELIERGQQVSPEELEACRAGREQLRRKLAALMADHGISAWIAPSAQGTAPATLESTGDSVMNLPWSHAGLPVVNLPSGLAENGLPLGLQLVAGWREDEKLLAWAGQIASQFRVPLNFGDGFKR
jgi:Asp-tRNA(Asn)/Glu-tRNA(Gln) amidotransferase A subunit family amidase